MPGFHVAGHIWNAKNRDLTSSSYTCTQLGLNILYTLAVSHVHPISYTQIPVQNTKTVPDPLCAGDRPFTSAAERVV